MIFHDEPQPAEPAREIAARVERLRGAATAFAAVRPELLDAIEVIELLIAENSELAAWRQDATQAGWRA